MCCIYDTRDSCFVLTVSPGPSHRHHRCKVHWTLDRVSLLFFSSGSSQVLVVTLAKSGYLNLPLLVLSPSSLELTKMVRCLTDYLPSR